MNVRPMSTRVIQMIENTNECFIMFSGYAIIIFSGWIYNFEQSDVDDYDDAPELRYDLGFAYLAMLGASVAVNLILVIYEIAKFLSLVYK